MVEPDGGLISGGEFARSRGTGGGAEDLLHLRRFRQGMEERRTGRIAGLPRRPRAVAQRLTTFYLSTKPTYAHDCGRVSRANASSFR